MAKNCKPVLLGKGPRFRQVAEHVFIVFSKSFPTLNRKICTVSSTHGQTLG